MGFDVYGLNPNNETKPDEPNWSEADDNEIQAYFTWQKNTEGAYFRANVWSWHPLWDFIHNHCQDIFDKYMDDFENSIDSLDKMYKICHCNSGFTVPSNVAKEISKRLYWLDKTGTVDQYEVDSDIEAEKAPMAICHVCNGTGTRKGWEGWQSEEEWLKTHHSLENEYKSPNISKIMDAIVHQKELKPSMVNYSHANRLKGCNSCHGVGKIKPFESNYRFRAEYLREFANFCDKSGGFQIC